MIKGNFVTAFIAAAGMGNRMKAPINKQFLTIEGVPVLVHTIKKIESSKYIAVSYTHLTLPTTPYV